MNADLTFLLEPAGTLDTLESVFAIARRGGLRLRRLRLDPKGADDFVYLRLSADDPDLLDLFRARLANLIGVHEIRVLPVGPIPVSA